MSEQTPMIPLHGQSDPAGSDGYVPGAWDEVRAAFMDGHISEQAYDALREALAPRQEGAEGTGGQPMTPEAVVGEIQAVLEPHVLETHSSSLMSMAQCHGCRRSYPWHMREQAHAAHRLEVIAQWHLDSQTAQRREILEQAAQAIEAERIPRPKNEGDDGYNEGLVDAIVVVRDLMPRQEPTDGK